jgi:hypothetical protein
MRNEERELWASNIALDPPLYLSRHDKKIRHWDIFLVTPSQRWYFFGYAEGRKREKVYLNEFVTLARYQCYPRPKIDRIVLSQKKMRQALRAAVLLHLQAPDV